MTSYGDGGKRGDDICDHGLVQAVAAGTTSTDASPNQGRAILTLPVA